MSPREAAGARPERRKLPRCHRCGKPIRRPHGWSDGAAVRRHYWSKHRDVMQAHRGKSGR